MHSLRLSFMALATMFSVLSPVAVSANDHAGCASGYMMTPVTMMGRFVFVNRISRRTLLQSITERDEKQYFAPLTKEIL